MVTKTNVQIRKVSIARRSAFGRYIYIPDKMFPLIPYILVIRNKISLYSITAGNLRIIFRRNCHIRLLSRVGTIGRIHKAQTDFLPGKAVFQKVAI